MPVNITQETLFSLTLELSRILQNTYNGVATSGNTTTIGDTNNDQLAGFYADAVYQGTAWLPVRGTTHLITGHATNALTISPATSTNVAVGEAYYAAPPFFPRLILIQSINRGLASLGKIPNIDTVTAVAEQESYTSTDDTTFGEEIIKVEIANDTAVPYDYTPHFRWRQEPDRTFYFDVDTYPLEAYPMRITYLGYSTELSADSDEISVLLNPELVIWTAAVHALRWKIQQTKQDDPTYQALLNEAIERAEALRRRHMQNFPYRTRHTAW